MTKVLIFTEIDDSWAQGEIKEAYPSGFEGAFNSFLNVEDYEVKYAYQNVDKCSLTEEMVDWADVMIWWGHMHHKYVPDQIAQYVTNSVREGLGIIFLHSSHISKGFKELVGTSGCLNCFENESIRERLWTIMSSHDIARGIPEYIDLGIDEMYGEPFGIPKPDDLVFLGWFNTGNVFRSGVCYYRDNGRVFYFQPGHETYPVYYKREIQQILKNAIAWAGNDLKKKCECHWTLPLEKI